MTNYDTLTLDDYKTARGRAKRATDTSNVDSEEETSRKTRRPERYREDERYRESEDESKYKHVSCITQHTHKDTLNSICMFIQFVDY